MKLKGHLVWKSWANGMLHGDEESEGKCPLH